MSILQRNTGFDTSGYEQSEVHTFVIPDGSLGADSDPVDFERPYFGINVWVNGTNAITQASTLVAQVATFENGGTLNPLWTLNGGERWASGAGLHAGFHFQLVHAANVQRIRFITSAVTNDSVTIYVQGYEPGIKG